MRVLFDTDVVLDVLLDRRPHSDHSAALFTMVEKGRISGFLCATSVTTLHDLSAKAVDSKSARACIEMLLSLFDVAHVNRRILASALALPFRDYEDAVVHESACSIQADAIVTRNLRDFKKSRIPVHPPQELLSLFLTKDEQG